MRKLTQEQFIEKAKNIRPEYDYTEAVYINNKTKVKVCCPIHGTFLIRPNDLFNGIGCPKCGGTQKCNTEEFVQKAKYVHNDFFSYDHCKYENSNKKVIVTCPIHGDFEIKANNHLNGNGCPHCRKDGIQHEIKKLKPVNASTKTYDTETFIEKAINKWGNRYSYEKAKYIKSSIPIVITCPIHGDFNITPNHFLNGQGCSKCARNNRLSTEEFIEKANAIHHKKYDYSKTEYISTHKPVTIICPEHGEFEQSPANHLKGEGCPFCKISLMERSIETFLKEHHYVFTKQMRFEWMDKLSLDFYLPDYRIGIECQGIQHFQPISFFGGESEYRNVVERDLRKRKLCEEHGITILYYANYDFNFPYEVLRNTKEILEKLKK